MLTLYLAADCHAKADWLVGINASAALARASKKPDSSLGRVQTPTLAMIASRYLEHRGFLPSNYWSLSVTLGKDDALRKFRYVEDIRDKATAEAIADHLKSCLEATITKVERKTVHEQPPLLYDLTELQKECNIHHDMSAEQTLNAAQSLYEKKLISYPRTGSRYIPADVMPGIPSLLRMILRMETFAHLYDSIDPLRTTRRSVDGTKVTDHHALIITGGYVTCELTANEQRVYDMICGRMLEAFGPRCEKETLLIEVTIDDLLFRSHSVKTVSAGWRAVYNRPEEPGGEDDDIGTADVEYAEDESLSVMGHSLVKGKTRPKPLYTEATLLAAMEMPCQRGQCERSSTMPSAVRNSNRRETSGG
jgi:DNA topoisomerase-3